MPDAVTLTTYVVIVLGFVFIPGPATLLTVARASTSGTKVGIATGAGIAAGDLIHTVMAVVGLSAIIAASAFLFTLIKYFGAAYLFYIGVRAILDRSEKGPQGPVHAITAKRAFKQAVIAELLNPKTALFFLAFLPQFVQPANGAVALQLSVLGMLFVALGLLSTLVFAFAAGKIGSMLRASATVRQWQGRVVGTIYCALGIRLALQER
ncbi:MAG: LysE family translocator [Pseudomonadota bacterium]